MVTTGTVQGFPLYRVLKGQRQKRLVGSLAMHQWNFKGQPGTQVALTYLGL